MKFHTILKMTILSLDDLLSSFALKVEKEEDSLLCFLFHGLFQGSEALQTGVVDPQQGITVEMFRIFVNYFQRLSYRFVSPEEVSAGLRPGGKYVLLTFDDGYYNNLRALPVLEEFDVPAVFFVSTDHVRYGKAFWWDVVFRESRKCGISQDEIQCAIVRYKQLKTDEVESQIRAQFGEQALKPVSDLDRPFTAFELHEFARNRLVTIGNHTKDHAILTNYSADEIREQIIGAQVAIREMTGRTPEIIAYPNGMDSPSIQNAAREAGLWLGIGVQPGKNRLPLRFATSEAMTMKRFTLWGNRPIDLQCRMSRSSLSLYRLVKRGSTRASGCFSLARHARYGGSPASSSGS